MCGCGVQRNVVVSNALRNSLSLSSTPAGILPAGLPVGYFVSTFDVPLPVLLRPQRLFHLSDSLQFALGSVHTPLSGLYPSL